MILELEFIFPAGRFHGEEWPPSPARVFQALIAGTHRGVHGLIHHNRRDEALRWLEAQFPPSILAPAATLSSDHLTNYVPNNDDKRPSTISALRPTSRLDNYVPFKDGKLAGHVRTAKTVGVHAFGAGKLVAYRWAFEGDASHADVVAAMASLVTYLGQTTDSVFCRGRVHTCPPSNVAADQLVYLAQETPGGAWLVPAPGFFALCQRRYPRSVSNEPPDFTNSRQVDYSPGGSKAANPTVPLAIFDLQRLDGRGAWWPEQVREPAGLVRSVLVEWSKKESVQKAFGADRVTRLLTGHRAAGNQAPSDGNGHFGIVPLPSLNHEGTADGRFRRVALVGWGVTNSEERALFDEATRALHGVKLHDSRDQAEGRDACALLRRTPELSARHWSTLWTSSSHRWRSVTPVILTGLLRPGRTLENLVARTLVQAGYPPEEIASVAAFSGPLVPHTRPARDYRIGKDDYLRTTPRCHVEVRFQRSVPGPLVLGRGRYAGLGLCLPSPIGG